MRARVPQITDTVRLTLYLGHVEEWAEELLSGFDCERTSTGLTACAEIGGNCNAVSNAASFLGEVEEALSEGEIDPMEFTLTAVSKAPGLLPGRRAA
jgi:hypothetical protein